jgi:hemoglobin
MNIRWLSGLVMAGVLLAQLGAAAQSMDKPSLYKRLGGYDAIAAVTDDFIGRLAADPDLGQFFKAHSTASLQRVRQLVVDQLCAATGGPCIYIGQPMKAAHAGLGITDAHWKKSVDLLVASLDKFKVPKTEQNDLLAIASSLKGDIVDKTN